MVRRFLAAALLALPLFGAHPTPTAAQDEGQLRPRLDTSTGTLQIELGNLFDPELRSALEEGFPVRVQLRVTLWRDEFFDDRFGDFDWRASVRAGGVLNGQTGAATAGNAANEARPQQYRLEVATGGESQSVSGFDALVDAMRRQIDVPLRPGRAGSYYYQLVLTVETLSASDLEELERWLQGESGPDSDDAVSRERESALRRGVRDLFVRALGMPSRRLELRRVFDWTGPSR